MRLAPILPPLLLATAASAQIERDLGAHVHGSAELNLAIEGERLDMEIEIPGMDVVGFERAPRNHAERAAIDAAIARLESGEWVVLSAAAGCSLTSAEVHTHGFRYSTPDHEDDDDHGDHDEHHHGHGEEGEAAHEGLEDHADHAEFHGKLSWRCARPQSLGAVDFRVGELFPALQRLTVQALSERGQRREDLPSGNGRVSLD